MFKAVIHCNFDDTERQENGLENIRNMLADAGGGADIVIVCHGPGVSLLMGKNNPNAATVSELLQEGASFFACENTLESKSLSRDDLLSGVGTVGSGAIEIIRRQQQGYGYFRP